MLRFLTKVMPLGIAAFGLPLIFCQEKQKSTSTYLWGNGHYQAIPGAPIQFNNFYPKKIHELNNFQSFAFSQELEAGINNKGELYVWPSKKVLSYAEPGYKQTRQNLVKILDNVIQVTFTDGFVWALNNKGEVYQWKLNKSQTDVFLGEIKHIKPLQNIKSIASGYDHFVALNDKGQVLTMGQNTLGQCGLLDNSRTTSPPYIENRISYPEVVPNIPLITKIACGTNHTLAIDNNGQLYGWGSNSNMQISYQQQFSKAQNPLLCSYCPMRILKNLENSNVKDMAAGEEFSIINTQNTRDKSVEVFGVGNNLKGQLGLGQVQHLKDVSRIQNLSNYVFTDQNGESKIVRVEQMACGKKHIIVLLNIGYVLEWGDNEYGQMGNKKRSSINKPSVMKQFIGKKVKGVYAGENVSAVVVEDD